MASAVFPVPVTSSVNASSITATAANVLYEGTIDFAPAIYTLTCVNTTVAKFLFYSGEATLITTQETVSGTVTINLATAADRVRVWTDTGSDVVVTITKVASALSDTLSGTIDTVTSTGTYTGTSASGYGYAVLVGGGGGGGGNEWNRNNGRSGGTGGVCSKLVALTGSMAVVIGAAGTGGTNLLHGNAGGTSTFASMSAGGGGGGQRGYNGQSGQWNNYGSGGVATGGTFNQTTNGTSDRFGPTPPQTWSFMRQGQLGTGSIGNDYYGGVDNAKSAATGYGGGGGGGVTYSNQSYGQISYGSDGGPGALIVLRY